MVKRTRTMVAAGTLALALAGTRGRCRCRADHQHPARTEDRHHLRAGQPVTGGETPRHAHRPWVSA